MNCEQKIENLDLSIYEMPTELPPFPVDASTWGKNSFYHHCDVTSQRKNFSVCCTIKRFVDQKSTIPSGYEQCAEAIRNNTCPALAMRAEEVKAGRALYYMPKLKVNLTQKTTQSIRGNRPAMSDSAKEKSAARIDKIFSKDKKVQTKSAPQIKPKRASPSVRPSEDSMINMDMGQILKDTIREEKSKKAEAETSASIESESTTIIKKAAKILSLKRLPGESPLEFARRKLKHTQE